MMRLILSISIVLLSSLAQGFLTPIHTSTHSSLSAAKGFGNTKNTPSSSGKKSMQQSPPPPPPSSADVSASGSGTNMSTDTSNPFTTETSSTDLSQGKAALEKMRRERAEQRNAELLKAKEIQEVDAMLRETPEAGVIPEKVAQRMGKRMLPFVGLPLFGAMGSFVGFWYMATYRDTEFQPALVAATSIALLLVGLVGITYSIISASWDPDREGSLLGFDEVSNNIENIKTGLSRSRENALVRDRVSPADLMELDRKESAKEKRQQSFRDKVGDELD